MRFASAGLVAVAGLLPATAPAQISAPLQRPEIPLGLDLYLPVPEANLLSAATVAIGRRLFFDSILSQDRRLACASCHDPGRAFTDGRSVSIGVFGREGTRNVPTLVNRAYGETFFWDGRITSLEEQVVQPIQHPKEMSMTLEDVVGRLNGHRVQTKQVAVALGIFSHRWVLDPMH